RRTLSVGAHGTLGADRDTDIGRTGDHRLQRLARARGVQEFELEVVLLEDAGLAAKMGNCGVPVATLADGELQLVLRGRRSSGGKQRRCSSECENDMARVSHCRLLNHHDFFSVPRSMAAVATAEQPGSTRTSTTARWPASPAAIAFAKVATRSPDLVTGPKPCAPCDRASEAMSMSGSEMRWPIQRFSTGRERMRATRSWCSS